MGQDAKADSDAFLTALIKKEQQTGAGNSKGGQPQATAESHVGDVKVGKPAPTRRQQAISLPTHHTLPLPSAPS